MHIITIINPQSSFDQFAWISKEKKKKKICILWHHHHQSAVKVWPPSTLDPPLVGGGGRQLQDAQYAQNSLPRVVCWDLWLLSCFFHLRSRLEVALASKKGPLLWGPHCSRCSRCCPSYPFWLHRHGKSGSHGWYHICSIWYPGCANICVIVVSHNNNQGQLKKTPKEAFKM